MKHYTKRTIVLCLASLLTVVGAFGAENYKNSLVSLKINNGSGGYISMTAFTEKPYNIPVKTVRQDANTYVLVYPETNCDIKPPKLNDYENIESISISTYPYTTESDGYTKIIVKTLGNPAFRANTTLFMPGAQAQRQEEALLTTKTQPEEQSSYWNTRNQEQQNSTKQASNTKTISPQVQQSQAVKPAQPVMPAKSATKPVSENNNLQNNLPNNVQQNYSAEMGFSEHSTILICILALIVLIASIFLISKDKMSTVVGDNNDFDLDAEKKANKKNSKKKGIRKTINKLDQKYKQSIKKESYNSYDMVLQSVASRQTQQEEQSVQPNVEEPKEESPVIVDLDTLYQEKQQQTVDTEDSEHDDLAEFLNEFKLDEPEIKQEEEFNEDLYQEIINNNTLSFTKGDIERINRLMQVELTPEMLDNIDKYWKTESSKPRPLSKAKVLENLLTTYSISQNIEFSKDDVDVIKQLMEVELDKKFVTDLTTNKQRVKTVEQELKQKNAKPHKTSEVLTLNVKGLLPDLSQELKKQGKKPIESEAKTDVVYFSEGYEYSKLSVSSELSNISLALKSKDANKHRPSDFLPIVEDGYEYSTLSIKDELPDLEDVKANPKKYEDKKPEKVKVDEDALLKSISNVTFKPFYTEVETAVNQFENFEKPISNNLSEQNEEQPSDIEKQSSNKQLDNIINSEPQEIKKHIYTRNDRINDDAEKLLKLIEEQQTQRALKKQAKEDSIEFEKELIKASKKQEELIENNEKLTTFEYKGKNYNLLKKVHCDSDTVCILAKSDDGYSVFGQYRGRRKELKHYDSLNSVNMQIRENEKQNDGSKQYLIKIGHNKFVIKLLENKMEFVMDLC